MIRILNESRSSISEGPVLADLNAFIEALERAVRFEGGEGLGNVSSLSARDSVDYWRVLNVGEGEPVLGSYEDIDPDDSSTVRREDYDCPATNTKVSLVVMEGAGHVAPSTTIKVTAFLGSHRRRAKP